MDQYIIFAAIGLGIGTLYAAIAMGIIITYRGTGIINFATGAMAMWGAYVVAELQRTGDLIIPVIVIPHRIHLGELPFIAIFVIGVASCALIGLMAHFLVFRPLRTAPVLAKVVASVGILLFLQALTTLQFGSDSQRVTRILPDEDVSFGSISFPRDGLWLALIVVVVALLLAAYYRYSRTGLATRAGAENERAISLARYSPQRLAGATWLLSSLVAGTIGILVAPTTVLNPVTYSLAVVPALAAALIGRFQSIGMAAAVGLALGSFQSIVTFQTSKPWWPRWAVSGLSDAVPLIIIAIALFALGDHLPTRGSERTDRLPNVIRPRNRIHVIIPLVVAGAAALLLTSGSYRFGVITSMIVSIIMLSLVLLTGLIGQISLAQAALAGFAGFTLSKLIENSGLPFPLSMLVASIVAAIFGVIIGIPALRIRGAQLAVVTLASAVALERFVFRNSQLTSPSGNPIKRPTLFGIDLGIRLGRNIARWQFGMLVLVLLTISSVLVGNLARSATGRRFLAVRSNERAASSTGISVATNKLVAFAMASFLAGLGGSLIGYSRGQLSAESFTAIVGMTFLAFAYLGGITSVSGAIIAGSLAPLGIAFVIMDRALDLGNSYSVLAGLSLIVTALLNPEGIAGATRQNARALARRFRRAPAEPQVAEPLSDSAPQTEPASASRRRRDRPNFSDRPIVFDARDIGVTFGAVRANDAVSLQVREGQIVGLIGPNGAGKTTFIDAVTGFVEATGQLTFAGSDLVGASTHERARRGLVRTWQSLELFSDLTVVENLRVANERATIRSVALDLVAPTRDVDLDQVEWALSLMGLDRHANEPPGNLSLGQQKLVGVARALASRPRLVMMDEPAAGLDSQESQALGRRLFNIVDHGISIFLIDHDMGLVLDVCDYIYVLDFGGIIAQGTPAQIRADEAVITAYLGQETAV